jgi:F-box interacting protein
MASGSEIDDENKVVYSEITAINDLFSAVVTLTSPPLPTLPEDVIPEILCRLSVKLLLQLRCVCKSWNALISDSKFVKKHLRMSTTRRLHFLSYPGRPQNKYILTSYPLDSILTNPKANFTQFEYSPNNFNGVYPRACFQQFIGSCNGILCFADDYKGLVILWNPSIRKFKELPLFTKPKNHWQMAFGFGYDSSKDKYKVVVVLDYYMPHTTIEGSWVEKIEVKVHTLGTNIWRNIQGYPFAGVPVWGPGKFVSGTINWLVSGSPRFIVSFDLANESYQKILLPIGGEDMCDLWSLGVLRDNGLLMRDFWW